MIDRENKIIFDDFEGNWGIYTSSYLNVAKTIWNTARQTDPIKQKLYEALSRAISDYYTINDISLDTYSIVIDALKAYEKEQSK